MKNLKIEEMQEVTGGGYWVWEPNLSTPHGVPAYGTTCQDVYNIFNGNALSASIALSGTHVRHFCMDYVYTSGGGGGGGGIGGGD